MRLLRILVSFILTVNSILCQQLNCEYTELIETGRKADCYCIEEHNTDNIGSTEVSCIRNCNNNYFFN